MNSYLFALAVTNHARTEIIAKENMILNERITQGEQVLGYLGNEVTQHKKKIGEMTTTIGEQGSAIEELTRRLMGQQNEVNNMIT